MIACSGVHENILEMVLSYLSVLVFHLSIFHQSFVELVTVVRFEQEEDEGSVNDNKDSGHDEEDEGVVEDDPVHVLLTMFPDKQRIVTRIVS